MANPGARKRQWPSPERDAGPARAPQPPSRVRQPQTVRWGFFMLAAEAPAGTGPAALATGCAVYVGRLAPAARPIQMREAV